MSDCLFCQIVAGDIASEQLWSDPESVAFRDVNPQAPVHVLVVPREHYATAAELAAAAPDRMGRLVAGAAAVAAATGIAESGYRLVFNSGRDGQQTVDHVHLHLLGGRTLTWPPG
ncbi:MAG: HIT domain-containing protein [Mycobacteriales bacterium]